MRALLPRLCGWLSLGAASPLTLWAESGPLTASDASSLPGAGVSLLRVAGALLLVLALFFAGVWCYRNSHRFAASRGKRLKLSILEVRSLGNRHAIYVVGYDRQRMLLSSSPTGVTLVSHLPEATAEEDDGEAAATASVPVFGDVLRRVLATRRNES